MEGGGNPARAVPAFFGASYLDLEWVVFWQCFFYGDRVYIVFGLRCFLWPFLLCEFVFVFYWKWRIEGVLFSMACFLAGGGGVDGDRASDVGLFWSW